jgi:hypothetical protein
MRLPTSEIPDPPKEWTGVMIGGPNETHVVLWCERELA